MTNSITQWSSQLIARELAGFVNELQLCEDEAIIWRTAPGITNPIGTLVLHVCGNLRFFVGGVLGGTGYVRDRPGEFSRTGLSRETLIDELQDTATVVVETLKAVTDDELRRSYPQVVGGVTMPTGLFLSHLAAHTAFHLGQAGYLRRLLTGDTRSAGPLPLASLGIATVSP